MAGRGIQFKFLSETAGLEAGLKRAARAFDGLRDEAKQADRALQAIDGKDVEIDLKLGSLAGIRSRLQAQQAALQASITDLEVDIDPSQALRDLARIEREIRRVDRMEANVEVKVDRDGRFAGRLAGLRGGVTDLASSITGSLPVVGRLGGALGAIGVSSGPAAAGVAAVAAAVASLVGPGLLGGAIAAGGLGIGKILLEEYAQIEAGNRKARVVFGDQLGTITEWAKSLGSRTGLGTREIVGLAAGIQDLLVPKGYSRSKAAEITRAVTERGTALAKFSGVETARGIEAVTSALLGEREQLKGLGVDISQSEVTAWLEDNKGAVAGMSEAQAEVAATLALIEQKSGDAWASYQEGAQGAQGILDTLKSSTANLKDAIVTNFGAPLVDILTQLTGGALSDPFAGITKWMQENPAAIKSFLIDMIDLILVGADAAVQLGRSLLEGFVAAWPVISNVMKGIAGSSAASLQAVGALLSTNPLTREMGQNLLGIAQSTLDTTNGVIAAGDAFVTNFAPTAIAGLQAVQDGIGVTRERLAAIKDTKLEVSVLLEQGSVAQAEQKIGALTDDELVALFATLDPNAESDTDKKLNDLAVDRATALFPELEGKSLAEVQAVLAELVRQKTIRALVTVDDSAVQAFLAKQQTIKVKPIIVSSDVGSSTVIGPNRPKAMPAPAPGPVGGAQVVNHNIVRVSLDGQPLRAWIRSEVERARPEKAMVA